MGGRQRADEGPGRHGNAHRAAISSGLIAAASALALLLAACEDLTIPGGSLTTADLVILPLAAGAPEPGGVSFYASNAHPTTRSLIHPDGFNTLFAQVTIPAGGLASLDGTPLGPTDSVLVTFAADPGIYGVRLAPEGLQFAASAAVTLTLSYVKYGDLTVAAGSRYADAAAYESALATWHETSPDAWSQMGGAGAPGSDVRASLSQAGHYVAAAPR